MGQIDWQSKPAYDNLQQHDAPGFAWEFLRRNLDFRADVKALANSGRRIPTNAQKEAFARKWGVRFRPAGRCPPWRTGAMDGAGATQRRGPYRR
jgi:hypothetical protein